MFHKELCGGDKSLEFLGYKFFRNIHITYMIFKKEVYAESVHISVPSGIVYLHGNIVYDLVLYKIKTRTIAVLV